MARNRKRSKARRRTEGVTARPSDLLSPSSRRAGSSPDARRSAPTSPERSSARDRADGLGGIGSPDGPGGIGSPDPIAAPDPIGAPDPIAHAAPDAELAAAQLRLGAPELTDELDAAAEGDLDELATTGGDVDRGEVGTSGNGARSVAAPARGGRAVARGASPVQRLLTFLRGSWAELQRVQWPDRRQVIQATGVVIGFVLVAGMFLGLSDLASSHLMDWILK